MIGEDRSESGFWACISIFPTTVRTIDEGEVYSLVYFIVQKPLPWEMIESVVETEATVRRD